MREIDESGHDPGARVAARSHEVRTDVSVESSSAAVPEDSLRQIDQIVDHWSHLRQDAAEKETCARIKREHFLEEFQHIGGTVIRPTMETAVNRLRRDGGGGCIEERQSALFAKPRVILWMSMQGEVANPRQDLNPFLQLDADPVHKRINVWEGDMVENQGICRATSPWFLSEVTPEAIMDRIVGILRRAGTHGVPGRALMARIDSGKWEL